MNVDIPISDFEIEMLNRLMHTRAFVEYPILEGELRQLINEQRSGVISSGAATEADFSSFENKTVIDITNFLKHNEFFAERPGRVFFLTEKGEQLKRQGSLQKYLEWEMQREAQLMADLHTIETQGYLKKDQTFTPAEKPPDKDFNYRILWYVLILGAIFLLWWYGKSHM